MVATEWEPLTSVPTRHPPEAHAVEQQLRRAARPERRVIAGSREVRRCGKNQRQPGRAVKTGRRLFLGGIYGGLASCRGYRCSPHLMWVSASPATNEYGRA